MKDENQNTTAINSHSENSITDDFENPMGGPIRIYMDGDGQRLVDARELHQFLEVGKMFAHWIKGRIDKYNFILNEDYIVYYNSQEPASNGDYAHFGEQNYFCLPKRASKEADTGTTENRGGHNKICYRLTLDMAKELAMVERNEKGKQARRYFIQCEKEARGGIPPKELFRRVDQIQREAIEEGMELARKDIAAKLKGLSSQRLLAVRRACGYKAMGLTNREVAKLMDTHKDTIRRALKQGRDIGVFGAPAPGTQLSLFDEAALTHG